MSPARDWPSLEQDRPSLAQGWTGLAQDRSGVYFPDPDRVQSRAGSDPIVI